ncbi:MAG: Penicillin-binding protein 1A [Firmicutes bacterium]|nr:Penicillin-binding protein 1A [Bacillota bacterium]
MYINEIYMGHGTYGVEAASRHYFNKRARDLSLPEATMLAGLIRGPEWYSPRANWERAQARQAWVLDRMATEGYISDQEATQAKAMEIALSREPRAAISGELLRSHIRSSLEQHMPNGSALAAIAGLRIFTTLALPLGLVSQPLATSCGLELKTEAGKGQDCFARKCGPGLRQQLGAISYGW